MSEELLINYTPMESRMAVLTDGVTSEILIERHQKLGLVGNIYLWILDKPELHFYMPMICKNPSVVATA